MFLLVVQGSQAGKIDVISFNFLFLILYLCIFFAILFLYLAKLIQFAA